MKRRQFLAAAAAPAVLAASPVRAQSRQKVTYAHLLDPGFDVGVWAIRNGKVKSDTIEVETTGLLIPQLLQATATKQYDVIMTAVIGVPAALARGLDVRILSSALHASQAGEGGGVWVKKGSPVKSGGEFIVVELQECAGGYEHAWGPETDGGQHDIGAADDDAVAGPRPQRVAQEHPSQAPGGARDANGDGQQ